MKYNQHEEATMHLRVRLSHVCDWDAAVSIETSVLNFLNLTQIIINNTNSEATET